MNRRQLLGTFSLSPILRLFENRDLMASVDHPVIEPALASAMGPVDHWVMPSLGYNPWAIGGNNAFDPVATTRVMKGWSTNPIDLPVNRYVEYKPSLRKKGFFRTAEIAGDRSILPYSTIRYRIASAGGPEEQDVNLPVMARSEMFRRASLAHIALESGPWTPSNSRSIGRSGAAWSWSDATAKRRRIYQSIAIAAERLMDAIGRQSRIAAVFSPETAIRMAETGEMKAAFGDSKSEFFRSSYLGRLAADHCAAYRLPPMYADVEFIIEDGGTRSSDGSQNSDFPSPCKPGVVYLVALGQGEFGGWIVGKPDDQEGGRYSDVASGVLMTIYEDVTVETWDDRLDRKIDTSLTSDYQVQIPDPRSVYKIEDLFAVDPIVARDQSEERRIIERDRWSVGADSPPRLW